MGRIVLQDENAIVKSKENEQNDPQSRREEAPKKTVVRKPEYSILLVGCRYMNGDNDGEISFPWESASRHVEEPSMMDTE